MPGHDIVVIGFSAGGIDPLVRLIADLPRDLPASVFVVHHFPAQSISALPAILGRASSLPTSAATDGDQIVPGHVYTGRPDLHLTLEKGYLRLSRGPREHGHRPAIDPLFRSAARHYGSRVIGILLSGTLDDGSAGMHAIHAARGLTIVQDPERCAYPGMVLSALEHVRVDHVATPDELGMLVNHLVREPAPAPAVLAPDSEDIDLGGPEPALVGTAGLRQRAPLGRLSTLTCPDCGGVLWDSDEGSLLHFRCHVGHAFSEESLLAKQSDALEGALWSALRALEEKAKLARELADRVRQRNPDSRSAERFEATARDAEHGSNLIRASLLGGPFRRALEAPAEAAPSDAEVQVGLEEPTARAKPG
jgi:two-component system, chemotaxis family, protein-glutamate methylesterase/glutaminase